MLFYRFRGSTVVVMGTAALFLKSEDTSVTYTYAYTEIETTLSSSFRDVTVHFYAVLRAVTSSYSKLGFSRIVKNQGTLNSGDSNNGVTCFN